MLHHSHFSYISHVLFYTFARNSTLAYWFGSVQFSRVAKVTKTTSSTIMVPNVQSDNKIEIWLLEDEGFKSMPERNVDSDCAETVPSGSALHIHEAETLKVRPEISQMHRFHLEYRITECTAAILDEGWAFTSTDLRDVNVDISLLQEVVVRIDLWEESLGDSVSNLCALLHDVTEVTSHMKITTGHCCRRVLGVSGRLQRPSQTRLYVQCRTTCATQQTIIIIIIIVTFLCSHKVPTDRAVNSS